MKIIAWNINGLRAMLKRDNMINLIEDEKPDIICFGETKLSCPIIDVTTTIDNMIKSYKYKYYSTCSTK